MAGWDSVPPQADAILGWYCDHNDEPLGKGSHIERVWRKKRQVWENVGNASFMRCMAFEKPVCPRAIPLRASQADIDLARPVYPTPAAVGASA